MKEEDLNEKISLSICTDDTFRNLYASVLKTSLNPKHQEVEDAYNSLINNHSTSRNMESVIKLARMYFNDYDAYCQKSIPRLGVYCLQHLTFLVKSESICEKQMIDFSTNKSLHYLYATREEIETHIKNRTYYEFYLCNNIIQITPTKKSNVCAFVTNKIADYSLADELLRFFQKTITDLIQGRIETFDDKDIPTLSTISDDNMPLVEGARVVSKEENQNTSNNSYKRVNKDNNTSPTEDTEYQMCISPHGLKFMLSSEYYNELMLPENVNALSAFGTYVETIEIFPALINSFAIIALAIFYPQATIYQYIVTILVAECFARMIRKNTLIYQCNLLMIFTTLFERIASFYIDSIIIIIISSNRFTYYYSIAYVVLALLCHFIFIGTYKNRVSLHNRLAIHAIGKFGNSYNKRDDRRIRF